MSHNPRLNKQDLNSLTGAVDGQLGLHDGTGEHPEGLYWYDASNDQWVKISEYDTGNSVTIGLL